MQKRDAGQYVRMDFELDADAVSAFRTRMKLKPDLFRIQILCAEKPAPQEKADAVPAGAEGVSDAQS